MNVFLGIDVSKGYADFILVDPAKKVLEKSFQLDDNRSGHQQLEDLLQSWLEKYPVDAFYCGLESTGGYENNWYGLLQKLAQRFPLHVARLNPKGVKAQTDADLKRTITDQVSALAIAHYIISYPQKVHYEHSTGNFEALRKSYSLIRLLTHQKTQLSNQLEKLVYSAFPELLSYCKNGTPTWVLDLLLRFPSALAVSKARVAELESIRYVSAGKAEAIHQLAQISVASELANGLELIIQTLAEEILHKAQRIDKLKSQCLLEQQPAVELLCSIKGISTYTAAGLVMEIEDVHRFPSAKQLACYFGLHPIYKQSGDGKWNMRMSKQGRILPRMILFMAACSAARCDEHMKSIYTKHRTNGKKHRDAIGVIMHKLLRVAYGVLKSGKPYDAAIDQHYQQAKLAKQKEGVAEPEIQTQHRRFQTLSLSAPVSRKNYQKRKKETSQGVDSLS